MLIPDIDASEERAAVCEYERNASRAEAEDLAAQLQGFRDREHHWQWLADYVVKRGVP